MQNDGREASSHPQSDALDAPDVVVIEAGRIEESEAHQSTAQGTPQLRTPHLTTRVSHRTYGHTRILR
jgi:hypothetical protein